MIAWHPDRLHRRNAELERYITACEKHGVDDPHRARGRSCDLSTAAGKMTARHVGVAAAYESGAER